MGGEDSRKRIDKLPARPREGVDEAPVFVRSLVEIEARPADPEGRSVDLRTASAALFGGVAMAVGCGWHFNRTFLLTSEIHSREVCY